MRAFSVFLATACALGAAEPMRTLQYTARSAEETQAWQQDLRAKLATLLSIQDLMDQRAAIPLDAKSISSATTDGVLIEELELRSTPGRLFKVIVARQENVACPAPGVVAIHGHGGNRRTPFNSEEEIYKNFGTELAKKGFIVISTDVGQHEVYEEGRILMGERLWDLMRCVDYLQSLDCVDDARVGCAGLSLGGEMAMWLGAMDTRIAAESSCGFLTRMDQMEQNHCMCWKFPGLRELVDYADIYALTAPRALQCQNGLREPETQFTPVLARAALDEIIPTYDAFEKQDNVQLLVHEGAHEIALEPMLAFLSAHLAK
ncbi:MAG: acetylxylan esterase [Candidatus Hydrogenedentes bacterium]|nr:acetylxylan esterase [Candidatus Hydrogenedentota bacterium]